MGFEVAKTEIRILGRTRKSEANAHKVSPLDSLRPFSSFRVSSAEIRKKDLNSHPESKGRTAAFLTGQNDPLRTTNRKGANPCR